MTAPDQYGIFNRSVKMTFLPVPIKLESGTGAAICASLAMLDNFTYPADIFPSTRFYHEDLSEQPLELTSLPDGTPAVEACAEIPWPDSRRLERLCLQRAVVKA